MHVTRALKSKLSEWASEGNSVASLLLAASDGSNAWNGKADYIGLTGDGTMSYLTESKVASLTGDPWMSVQRTHGRPGRVARMLLTPYWLERLSDSNFEQFANLVKAQAMEESGEFQIAQGDDIAKWYYEGNVQPGCGSLAKSCMRYEFCTPFMGIYTNNPDVVSMVTRINDKGLLTGRALLWNSPEHGKVMDRIYGSDAMVRGFRDYAIKQRWFYRQSQTPDHPTVFIKDGNVQELRLALNVEEWQQPFYPYMDTMLYLFEDGVLANYKRLSAAWCYTLREVRGGPLLRKACVTCGAMHRERSDMCSPCWIARHCSHCNTEIEVGTSQGMCARCLNKNTCLVCGAVGVRLSYGTCSNCRATTGTQLPADNLNQTEPLFVHDGRVSGAFSLERVYTTWRRDGEYYDRRQAAACLAYHDEKVIGQLTANCCHPNWNPPAAIVLINPPGGSVSFARETVEAWPRSRPVSNVEQRARTVFAEIDRRAAWMRARRDSMEMVTSWYAAGFGPVSSVQAREWGQTNDQEWARLTESQRVVAKQCRARDSALAQATRRMLPRVINISNHDDYHEVTINRLNELREENDTLAAGSPEDIARYGWGQLVALRREFWGPETNNLFSLFAGIDIDDARVLRDEGYVIDVDLADVLDEQFVIQAASELQEMPIEERVILIENERFYHEDIVRIGEDIIQETTYDEDGNIDEERLDYDAVSRHEGMAWDIERALRARLSVWNDERRVIATRPPARNRGQDLADSIRRTNVLLNDTVYPAITVTGTADAGTWVTGGTITWGRAEAEQWRIDPNPVPAGRPMTAEELRQTMNLPIFEHTHDGEPVLDLADEVEGFGDDE